jgi:hypothetical protein
MDPVRIVAAMTFGRFGLSIVPAKPLVRRGAERITAPFAGFLSQGQFARIERKFEQHFKGLFWQAYRKFEFPPVRK